MTISTRRKYPPTGILVFVCGYFVIISNFFTRQYVIVNDIVIKERNVLALIPSPIYINRSRMRAPILSGKGEGLVMYVCLPCENVPKKI